MRKICNPAALLLAVMLVLTGCGSGNVAGEETVGPTLTKPTAAPQTDPNTLPAEQPGQAPAALGNVVIYDQDEIRISVTGLEKDHWTGVNIKLLVENGSDRNIAFCGDLFVINGITVPGYLYAQTAAGMKSNDAIELYSDALERAGIGQIATIVGYDTRIVDTDTLETLAKVPMMLETTAAAEHEQAIDDSGSVLFEEHGVTVIAQVISEEFYGKTVQLLVKNGTGKDIIVEAENISVNGYTIDAWLYDTVCADTVRFCQLDLFSSGLEENGIEAVENVTFSLEILDAMNYDTIYRSDLLEVVVQQ